MNRPTLLILCLTPNGRLPTVRMPFVFARRSAFGGRVCRFLHTSAKPYVSLAYARELVRFYDPPRGWRKIAFEFNGQTEVLK